MDDVDVINCQAIEMSLYIKINAIYIADVDYRYRIVLAALAHLAVCYRPTSLRLY